MNDNIKSLLNKRMAERMRRRAVLRTLTAKRHFRKAESNAYGTAETTL